ncbi:MAG: ankyrin repeat domain-containing protein [Candidatus Dependentiae bacterium]
MKRKLFSMFICLISIFGYLKASDQDFNEAAKWSSVYQLACATNNAQYKNEALKHLLPYKQIVLVAAAYNGDVETVKAFVKFPGVDINVRHNGCTPLLIAAQEGYFDITKLLLDAGADKTLVSKKHCTALHLAALHGRIKIAELLIDQGIDLEALSIDRHTPLSMAVINDQLEMVTFLLSKGANLHFKTAGGNTLLHLAIVLSFEQLSKYLVSTGIDLKAQNAKGHTALHFAAQRDLIGIIELLVKERGVPVDIASDSGVTSLHTAVHVGKLSAVKRLITLDADIHAKTSSGIVPLHIACSQGHLDIATYLLRNGANKDAIAHQGSTPLYFAVLEGHPHIVDLLLKYQVNARTQLVEVDEGFTALHKAAQYDRPYLINKLCSYDKKLANISDSHGVSPLFLAAQYGCLDAVEVLINYKADLHQADKYGKKPIDIAKQNDHKAIARLLQRQMVQQQKQVSQKQKQQAKRRAKKLARKNAFSSSPPASVKKEIVSLPDDKKEVKQKSVKWLQVDPSHIFDCETCVLQVDDSHAAFRQLGRYPMTLVLYNRRALSKENSPKAVRLHDNYKEKHKDATDKFHLFSNQLDDYLSYGVRIDDTVDGKYKQLCDDIGLYVPANLYAIVIPGKIEHKYYDYTYAIDDQYVSTRTGFNGAFVYIFDKDDVCYHRCFHESKASRKLHTQMNSF